MVSSPYLAAIQSLDGVTPGDKFRKLNNLANEISSTTNLNEGSGDLQTVPPPLAPLARIPIAKKIKNNEFIVEALKSEDVFVVNNALKAKFFFNPSNPDLNPKFFSEKMMPYVTLQTRFKIIKKLSICLIKDEKAGEDFFIQFLDVYGIKQATPLLIACSENFTYDIILKHKVVFPIGILEIIFRIKPNLVVRYLQLGNKKNDTNKKDREQHEISISAYIEFLPKLVKYHLQDFIALLECIKHWNIKLENKKAILFLKNALHLVIDKPKVFLDILELKLVSKKLNENDFATMYKNLFPDKLCDFQMAEMIGYLEYYPKNKRFDLLAKKFKEVYGEDILNDITRVADYNFLLLLPDELREKQALRVIESGKVDYYYDHWFIANDWRCYLPPKDSVQLFQNEIKKESDMYERSILISKMVFSCHVYNDKNELNNVLIYYNDRHKNEQKYVLANFLEILNKHWIEKLDCTHWTALKNIIQRAHIKDEFLKVPIYVISSLIEGLLGNILLNSKENSSKESQEWYNTVIKIAAEFIVKSSKGKFSFLKETPILEQEVLNQILIAIPKIYPADHEVWESEHHKVEVTISCFKSMVDFNSRNTKKLSEDSEPSIEVTPFKLNCYPWLVNFSKEILLMDSVKCIDDVKELRRLLKCHEPEIYKEICKDITFGNRTVIRSVKNGDALVLLRKYPEEVIKNWKNYLEEAKSCLLCKDGSAAKQFIRNTKWYKDIPVYFVSHALENLEDEGFILVLGILLEGDMFSKIITPFIPKESELNVLDETAKKNYKIVSRIPSAMIMTNPPCDLDVIASFCRGDYLSLSIKCLTNVARRVSMPSITKFGKRLMLERVSLKKHGIRIVAEVSPRKEWIKLLTDIWIKEKHYSIREIMASEILIAFKNEPSDETFNLMKKCINKITPDEKCALKSIFRLNSINKKYVSLYFTELFQRIVVLSKENPNFLKHNDCISTITDSINEKSCNYIEESILLEFVNKYFFVPDSPEISNSVHNFVVKNYLLSAQDEKFESRLNAISEIFNEVVRQWRTPLVQKLPIYPANRTLFNFIEILLREMFEKKFTKYEIVIETFLKTFSSSLSPWQYPESYINLKILNLYFSSPSAKEFGLKCAKQLPEFVNEFSTELILNNIVDCLSSIKCMVEYSDKCDYLLDSIQGLIEGDKLYGSIVGIRLLKENRWEINLTDDSIDSRYEFIIQTLGDRSKDSIALQYVLNEYLNRLE